MKYLPLAILICLSIFTHFLFFGRPNQVVFDEVYYVNFAASYATGNYYFDVHPPLAKLMYAKFGSLGGVTPDSSKLKIGNTFSGDYYLWYRFLSTLAGTLLPLIIFLVCRRLRMSELASFFAGLAIILENSLLVQSRFILPEIFILLFGFTGILLYLNSISATGKKKILILQLFSVAFLTFAFSIKWTGLSFLGLAVFIELVRYFSLKKFRTVFNTEGIRWLFGKISLFLIIPFLIYFSIFLIHFSLLKHSGHGDSFMTPGFQKTLEGNKYEKDQTIIDENSVEKFIELNTAMFLADKLLIGSHSYGSKWYTWPIMTRPIFYWQGTKAAQENSKIYLLGNPLVYWISSLSVVFLLFYVACKKWKGRRDRIGFLLLSGYAFNFLPFILIKRGMFLYHYLPALVFSIIILAYLLDKIKNNKIKTSTVVFFSLIFLSLFVYFSPLTYGIKMDNQAQESRFWFKRWK